MHPLRAAAPNTRNGGWVRVPEGVPCGPFSKALVSIFWAVWISPKLPEEPCDMFASHGVKCLYLLLASVFHHQWARVSEAAAHGCISSFHRELWSHSCPWNKHTQSQKTSGSVGASGAVSPSVCLMTRSSLISSFAPQDNNPLWCLGQPAILLRPDCGWSTVGQRRLKSLFINSCMAQNVARRSAGHTGCSLEFACSFSAEEGDAPQNPDMLTPEITEWEWQSFREERLQWNAGFKALLCFNCLASMAFGVRK